MLEQHIRYLSSRGVSEATWAARGVRSLENTVENAQHLLDLHFEPYVTPLPGFLTPLYDPQGGNGRYQYHPTNPVIGKKGKPIKHVNQCSPEGTYVPPILDVHPKNTPFSKDITRDLWITEGIAKADAAAERDLYAVGLLGVSMWRNDEQWGQIAIKGRRVYICFDSDLMEKPEVHSQMVALGKEIARKRPAALFYVYLPPAEDGGKQGLDDFFAAGHDAAEAYAHAEKRVRPLPEAAGDYLLSDTGNGMRFRDQHAAHARYSAERTRWIVWCGTHWQMDDKNDTLASRLADQTVESILAEVMAEPDAMRRGALAKWYAESQSVSRIRNMLTKAAQLAGITATKTLTEFDPPSNLFNCVNGTVDLTTGELLPHNPADMLTHLCPTPYIPGATHPVWTRYLDELGVPDDERAFLLRAMGYSLFRDNLEERFFFIEGPGASGKGTFIEAVQATLGLGDGYAYTLNADSLAGERKQASETFMDIKQAAPAHVLLVDEWPKTINLNDTLVKKLTGGGVVMARGHYQEFEPVECRFTLWLFGNYMPRPPADETGIWRRFLCLSMPIDRSREGIRSDYIKRTLKGDAGAHAAILSDLVAGAGAYHRRHEVCTEGEDALDIPPAVLARTDEHRNTDNIAEEWLNRRTHDDRESRVTFEEAHEDYKTWEQVANRNYSPLDKKIFVARLEVAPTFVGAGYKRKKDGHRGNFFLGFGLGERPDGDDGDAKRANSINSYGTLLREGQKRTFSVTNVTNVADLSPPPLRRVTTAEEVPAALAALAAPGRPLAIDIETTGLPPRRGALRLLQVCDGERVTVFDAREVGDLRPQFAHLATCEVIGHNLAFEFSFLPPVRGMRAWDTMLASQVLNGGLWAANNLATVALVHAGVALDKAMQVSDWSGDLTDEQIAYAARDVAYLHTIKDDQIGKLVADGLLPTAELEMRALMGVQWMAGNGVAFDWFSWEAMAREKLEMQGALLAELREVADINWQSGDQIKTFFKTQGIALDNTQEATLETLDSAAARLLVRYRKLKKLSGTYGLNWAQHLHEGRIYAGWWQIETATGRMSCKEPNLQNVPTKRTARAYRACLVAPEGRVLIKADYSQIELRIAAQMAGDRTMLDAFRDGIDLHKLTASRVAGKPLAAVTGDDRQLAKAVNFGFLYGMGAVKFQSYAEGSYGVVMSGADAFNAREAFFALYPGLRAWHKEQGGGYGAGPEDTFTLGGRRRRAARFYTEKLNSPVQGTGADGIKNALALLWEHPLADDIFPVLCVHDEIVVEAPAARAEEAKEWLVGHMVDGMAAYLTAVPVEVEATIARNWAGGE